MLEYPSIITASKAPKEYCIAFDKLDGSNIRIKFNHKNGFTLFGSRHQLFDETHPFLAGAIPSFKSKYEEELTKLFHINKDFKDAKEIICFGEYVGEKSFAGFHESTDSTKTFILFDILKVYKSYAEFMKPQDFIKTFDNLVEIPKIIYEGNLTNEFIKNVRENKYELNEGVICKGTVQKGSFRGKTWMCKIKTNSYLDKLKNRFGDEWEKYGE